MVQGLISVWMPGLLANSDLPLSTLALDLGFYDQSHFTKVFRQLTGTKPGMFREEYALHKKTGLRAALTSRNPREVRAG
jgi:AraC-like DNA-binding protein